MSLLLFLFLLLCYSDTDTVVGLPRPIHESIKTLKQVWLCTSLCCLGDFFASRCLSTNPRHVETIVTDWTLVFLQHKYVSIAEIQVAKEEEFQKTPLSGVSGNKLFEYSSLTLWKCCRLCSDKVLQVWSLSSLLWHRTVKGSKNQTFCSLSFIRVKRRWRCPPSSSFTRGFCPVCLSIWFVLFFYVGIFCVKATTQAEDLKSLMIGLYIGHLKQTSVRVKVSMAKILKCGSKSSKCNICAKDVAAKDNQRDTTNLIWITSRMENKVL